MVKEKPYTKGGVRFSLSNFGKQMVVLILHCSLMGPGLIDLTRTYLVPTFSVMERRVGV